MAENATDLRLATILALDVVGFSAMMNSDELGTLRKVQTLQREIIFPQVERNGGTIFKLIGDGVLAHFPKVDGAFECGKEILGELARSVLKDGSVSELARLSQLNVARQEDGSASFSLSTDRSVNAILLIDSASSIPPSVVSEGNLDVTSFRKLESAAGDGDWNAELHWFDPDSSSPLQL